MRDFNLGALMLFDTVPGTGSTVALCKVYSEQHDDYRYNNAKAQFPNRKSGSGNRPSEKCEKFLNAQFVQEGTL